MTEKFARHTAVYTGKRALQKFAPPKMGWNSRDPQKWRWPIRPTASGAIAVKFVMDARKSSFPDAKMAKNSWYRLIRELWAWNDNPYCGAFRL